MNNKLKFFLIYIIVFTALFILALLFLLGFSIFIATKGNIIGMIEGLVLCSLMLISVIIIFIYFARRMVVSLDINDDLLKIKTFFKVKYIGSRVICDSQIREGYISFKIDNSKVRYFILSKYFDKELIMQFKEKLKRSN